MPIEAMGVALNSKTQIQSLIFFFWESNVLKWGIRIPETKNKINIKHSLSIIYHKNKFFLKSGNKIETWIMSALLAVQSQKTAYLLAIVNIKFRLSP
ncbi:hypothetical protein [uncultured Microscilla sp.]|uniref:hypothetical protein n=1 Tax=uncultured Microscilla sp. TaxID=432653 RepID=UPI002622A107|nr:hypothetical protein [uncultured Microscilla sp.]